MGKDTDISAIKSIAISFLHLPLEVSDFGPAVLHHPFFNSAFIMQDGVPVDILNNIDAYHKQICYVETAIGEESSVHGIWWMIQKAYRLLFFKHINAYLSQDDYGYLLRDAWVASENPNGDPNVDIPLIVSWFRNADKRVLMSRSDYEIWQELPNRFIAYRGVAVGRVEKGLSWTRSLQTAYWFAHRFDGTDKGYILKTEVQKRKALAFFNNRGEDEVVLCTRGLKYVVMTEDEIRELLCAV